MKNNQNVEDLITVEDAATILGLNPKTIYNRKGGTGHLLRVKQGRTVRLLRSEVEGHKKAIIDGAKQFAREYVN